MSTTLDSRTFDDGLLRRAEDALHRGSFAEPAGLYSQLLDTTAEQQDTRLLTARTGYALALYGLADFPAGEDQLRHALEGRQHLLGADHPDTLTTMARLADNLGEQGRWEEARALASTVVDRATNALGPDHAVALSARLTYTWVLYRTAPHEAEAAAHQLVRDVDRVLGPDHRGAWAAYHLNVEVLLATGKFQEAETAAVALVNTRERHQGADHPHTLRARADLALTLHAAGRADEARALIDTVVKRSIQVLGEENPYTLRVITDRGTITGSAG